MLKSRRPFSSLAEKLREAAVSEGSRRGGVASSTAVVSDDAVDGKGEPFRDLFVMPKRKLQAQLQLERITGRAVVVQRSRTDIHDRLAVRRPREEEMRTDQDWPSVWPAARSFASSVVPLPVRMGSRHYPEKRAPFKKQGNLELVKIPNFLHLTPAAIARHCEAIKKFCTPFPTEFSSDPEGAVAAVPVTVKYADYVHQGTNIRDNRARVVTMQLKVSSLKLDKTAREKFVRLAGNRYVEETDTLTITTDRCYTRAQNWDYAHYLLTVLYHEANKVEQWETLKQQEDELKLEFEGSASKDRLVSLLEKVVQSDKLHSPLCASLSGSDEEKKKAIEENPKVVEFAKMWKNYMNTEETPEATRAYAAAMKELLGFKETASKSASVN